MKQILIISDTHFMRRPDLRKFIEDHPAITTIHCGDIYPGYKSGDIPNIYIARGNNDYFDTPYLIHFTLEGIKFVVVHGHRNSYAYDPLRLKELLNEYEADIILYGHTHVPFYYKDDDVIIANPGSVTLGRTFPRLNSYILLDVETREMHFMNVKTEEEFKPK